MTKDPCMLPNTFPYAYIIYLISGKREWIQPINCYYVKNNSKKGLFIPSGSLFCPHIFNKSTNKRKSPYRGMLVLTKFECQGHELSFKLSIWPANICIYYCACAILTYVTRLLYRYVLKIIYIGEKSHDRCKQEKNSVPGVRAHSYR